MQVRPEGERKLSGRVQRRVDERASRYAAQLSHAEELAARFGCGAVIGVFTARAGGGATRGALVAGLLPLAAIPVLIAAVAVGVRGVGVLLLPFPFAWAAWFGLCMLWGREPRRSTWCYAFAEGFLLLDDPRTDPMPVRWSQVTEVGPVWTPVYHAGADEMDPRMAVTAYRLRSADGQAHVISRSFQNVRDPYGEVGQMLKTLMPGAAGMTLPSFPTIDDVIAAYAAKRGPRA